MFKEKVFEPAVKPVIGFKATVVVAPAAKLPVQLTDAPLATPLTNGLIVILVIALVPLFSITAVGFKDVLQVIAGNPETDDAAASFCKAEAAAKPACKTYLLASSWIKPTISTSLLSQIYAGKGQDTVNV